MDFTATQVVIAIIALVVVLLAAWWLVAANRKTAIKRDAQPQADGPARRNQALIDANAPQPPPTPEGLAGVGTAIAAGAEQAQAGDDLRQIKGVGPKVEALLHGMGVTTYAEIAAWTETDVDRIDSQLGQFSGRIRRDDWRTQARLLATGDTAGYQATFGKL